MTEGQKAEEIPKLFNIVSEFTPEEEAQVRKENSWRKVAKLVPASSSRLRGWVTDASRCPRRRGCAHGRHRAPGV